MQDYFQKSKILYTGAPPKRLKKFIARPIMIGLIFMLFAAILGGFLYAVRLSQFRIQEVTARGAEFVSEEKIREAVMRQIAGARFFFIPNDSLLFVSSRRVERELLKEFPRLAAVDAKKTFAPALEILLRERSIWGIGCIKTELAEVDKTGETIEARTREKTVGPCFYIDSGGFAFEEVTSFEGQLLPALYKSGEGAVGANIFSKEDLVFFNEVSRALSDSFDLPLFSVEFFDKNNEDVRLTLKEGWSLVVSRGKAASAWIPVLRAVLSGEIKDRRSKLDYMDLRFGNKVFYKFRN